MYRTYQYILLYSSLSIITSNLDGSKTSGFEKYLGLWWIFLKSGITFHPLGIKCPVYMHVTRIIDISVLYFSGPQQFYFGTSHTKKKK